LRNCGKTFSSRGGEIGYRLRLGDDRVVDEVIHGQGETQSYMFAIAWRYTERFDDPAGE
jgi:hypothetical protein